MKRPVLASITIAFATVGSIEAAGPGKFDGEFVDKKYLDGQAVFEFSVQQSGNTLTIAFDAAYSDGHGVAPESTGTGRVTGSSAQFTWKDSHRNLGSGTITLVGDDILLSLKPTRMSDPRCAPFYRENIKLKRMGKKLPSHHRSKTAYNFLEPPGDLSERANFHRVE